MQERHTLCSTYRCFRGMRPLSALFRWLAKKKHQGKQSSDKENKQSINSGSAGNESSEVLGVFIHKRVVPELPADD